MLTTDTRTARTATRSGAAGRPPAPGREPGAGPAARSGRRARPAAPVATGTRSRHGRRADAGRAAGPETAARSRRPAHRSPTAKGGSFWLLVTLVVILCLMGVVMVLSASSIVSLQSYGSPWHFFIRQWVWLIIGSVGFVVAMRVDHQRWRKPARLITGVTLGMLLAVLVPGVGVRAYGAARWIGTSSVQIQPSELAKLALIIFTADILDRRAGRGDWKYQAAPVLAVLGLMLVLVMAQPDMGTSLVLATIAVAMLFTAGLPGRVLVGMGGVGVAGAYLLAKAAPYRWKRMTAFLHPFADARNTGYQSVQALLALSHGHVLGAGLGSSIASYGYLPNAQTDFIFAVIGEETGLVGGFFITGLFLTLTLVGVRVACRAPSRYAALMAAGITAWLVGQAVINIGAVVGLLPVTGVPLPFVSFGGSALVICLFGVGILANIAKQS
ncbi:MAG TPA: putative lipid II flippase FtsW [Acidimicrobiales bacterium]|nr:putative lipid II flippase FtsW [Acidimicrobiales bacterium]